jgi:hypothetical protein
MIKRKFYEILLFITIPLKWGGIFRNFLWDKYFEVNSNE